jgi:hypothetical protein
VRESASPALAGRRLMAPRMGGDCAPRKWCARQAPVGGVTCQLYAYWGSPPYCQGPGAPRAGPLPGRTPGGLARSCRLRGQGNAHGHATQTPPPPAVYRLRASACEPLPPRPPTGPHAAALQPTPRSHDSDAVPRPQLRVRPVPGGLGDISLSRLLAGVCDSSEPRDPPLWAASRSEFPGAVEAPPRCAQRAERVEPPDSPDDRSRGNRVVPRERFSAAVSATGSCRERTFLAPR